MKTEESLKMQNSERFFNVLILSKVPPERYVFARKKCTCETEKGVKQQKSGEISEGTSMGGTPCRCLVKSNNVFKVIEGLLHM